MDFTLWQPVQQEHPVQFASLWLWLGYGLVNENNDHNIREDR